MHAVRLGSLLASSEQPVFIDFLIGLLLICTHSYTMLVGEEHFSSVPPFRGNIVLLQMLSVNFTDCRMIYEEISVNVLCSLRTSDLAVFSFQHHQMHHHITKCSRKEIFYKNLLLSQCPRPSPFHALLLLVALFKGDRLSVVSAHIVQVFDLVDSDNPVFARESLLQRRKLGSLRGHFGASDSVLGLAGREEGIVIVVGHLVPRI